MTIDTGITARHVYAAARRIAPFVRRTPLEMSHYYSELTGAPVLFKLENLQVTGAFKVRGATNKILMIAEETFDRGVITVSAGNHALGFGYACASRGKKGLVVVPETASPAKIASLKTFPVDVEYRGRTYDEAEDYTFDLVKQRGGVFVSPYNDPEIVAGQGTIGLEIFQELPEVDVVIAPVGGGGMLAGIAAIMHTLNSEIKYYGVQSEASPVYKRSFDAGEIVEMEVEDSIAEGLHGRIAPDAVPFPFIRDLAEDILLVSEEEIRAEFAPFMQRNRQMIEASAVVVPAAVRRYADLFRGKTVVGVLSGANIDVKLLANLLKESGNVL